jgi:uncharacterized membrane protein YphA (DoxX/SURF4 family)
MNVPVPRGDSRIAQAAGVLVRWLLGGLFIYMGMSKALHPVEFLKLVRQYDLVQTPWLLNAIAAGLPWFEVFCGLLLLAGIAVRGASVVLIGMLVPFTFVVAHRGLILHTKLGLPFCAVKFDCGCGNGEVFVCWKLLENGLLLLLGLWLLAGHGQKGCMRYRLAGAPVSDPAPSSG